MSNAAKNFAKKYFPRSVQRFLLKTIDKYKCLKRWAAAHKYRGGNVYCPCCGRSFSGFQSYRLNLEDVNLEFYNRPDTALDVVCPLCGSFPRHRIFCSFLDGNKPSKSSAILVFAPTHGQLSWFARNKLKYISADLHMGLVDVKCDIQSLPFEDNTFDLISCDHVLEHVPDYVAALSELYRVVKAGNGCVEITVPMLPELNTTYEDNSIVGRDERIAAFGYKGHLRIFGNDFIDVLRSIGFDVVIYDGSSCDDRIRPVVGPGAFDSDKIFLCKKHEPKRNSPRMCSNPHAWVCP